MFVRTLDGDLINLNQYAYVKLDTAQTGFYRILAVSVDERHQKEIAAVKATEEIAFVKIEAAYDELISDLQGGHRVFDVRECL